MPTRKARSPLCYDPQPRRPPTPEQPITVNLRSAPADVVVPLHSHVWAQLAYPVSGTMQVAAAGMSWIVPAFRAVWIPPCIEHEVTMIGRVELRTLYIHADFAPLPLDGCAVIEVSPLLRTLSETLGQGVAEPRCGLMMRLALEEMRVAPPLSLGLPLPQDRRLKALCDALMADPAAPHSLRDWAQAVGASERTLARLFLAEMNTSFAAWRQQLRLARALDAMGRGLPLAQVAADVGYDSQAAFSTMFKRALGVAPSRFARSG